tara:strand:+ start:311 stop:541 length:231 start_codon:yes stop_codon:yes gene_type:complete
MRINTIHIYFPTPVFWALPAALILATSIPVAAEDRYTYYRKISQTTTKDINAENVWEQVIAWAKKQALITPTLLLT